MPDYYLEIEKEKCYGCGNCITVCPVNALSSEEVACGRGTSKENNFGVSEGSVTIFDPEFCTGCGTCVRACGYDAINIKTEDFEDSRFTWKIDNLKLKSGDKARIYNLLNMEKSFRIKEIAEELGISTQRVANLVMTLKNENQVFANDKFEEDHKVEYSYSTRKIDKSGSEVVKEKEEVSFDIDPEKAALLKKNLEITMNSFNVVKVKMLLETGKLDKAKEELVSRLSPKEL